MIGRAKPTPAQFFGWADFSASFFFATYKYYNFIVFLYS